ncbi:hypothetical protein KCV87_09840 [Actinosynnema pretiosum subsp. pretiosum]|uniref:Uncharacterized protein n=1 Tax=Actinosynnema pretiosum subsp. pretiosum TaxID=103721 RepID=A0AA45LE04_9PSEU|nr:hypothetical protein KCV87_09840 [Actinosynnema pretiosum subsp. pretiosum]
MVFGYAQTASGDPHAVMWLHTR